MNNDVFPNKFKAALAAKQVQIGCWSALSNPISTEVLGLAGFDWRCWMANMRQTISPRLFRS
ncbi:hypothetical protein ACLK19_20920 [Escherichia coli]